MILLILKIIGKILLILLLVILAVILLLLFTPFGYSVNLEYYNALKAKVRFHDFLRFLSVKFDYDGESDFSVHILWGRVKLFPKGNPKKKESKQKASKKKNSKTFDENFTEREVSEEEEKEYRENLYRAGTESTAEVNVLVSGDSESSDKDNSSHADSGTDEAHDIKKKPKKEKKKKQKKSRPGFSSLLKEIMSDEYADGRKILIDKVLKLVKHIWPDIKEADVTYSLGEPDTTGYATAFLAMMPFIYGKKKSFNPDFASEKPYFRGYIIIDGKLFLYYVLYIVISLFANKDSRKLIMKLIKG